MRIFPTMMSALAVIALAGWNSAAIGQTIKLVCNGTMHQYEPSRMEATAGGATTIDLESKRIVTPVGHFRITNVEETAIYFDDPGQQLKVFGRLDRLTGKMRVIWRRPEEEAKLQSGLVQQIAMYSDLSCSTAKSLF